MKKQSKPKPAKPALAVVVSIGRDHASGQFWYSSGDAFQGGFATEAAAIEAAQGAFVTAENFWYREPFWRGPVDTYLVLPIAIGRVRPKK